MHMPDQRGSGPVIRSLDHGVRRGLDEVGVGGAVKRFVVAGRAAAAGDGRDGAMGNRALAPVHALSHGVGTADRQSVGAAKAVGGSGPAGRGFGCVVVDADIANNGFLRFRGRVGVVSGQGTAEGDRRRKARNELRAGFRTSESERVLHRLADRDSDAVNNNRGEDHEVDDRGDNGAEALASAVVGDGVVGDLDVEDSADTDGAEVSGEERVLPRSGDGRNELLLRGSQ